MYLKWITGYIFLNIIIKKNKKKINKNLMLESIIYNPIFVLILIGISLAWYMGIINHSHASLNKFGPAQFIYIDY